MDRSPKKEVTTTERKVKGRSRELSRLDPHARPESLSEERSPEGISVRSRGSVAHRPTVGHQDPAERSRITNISDPNFQGEEEDDDLVLEKEPQDFLDQDFLDQEGKGRGSVLPEVENVRALSDLLQPSAEARNDLVQPLVPDNSDISWEKPFWTDFDSTFWTNIYSTTSGTPGVAHQLHANRVNQLHASLERSVGSTSDQAVRFYGTIRSSFQHLDPSSIEDLQKQWVRVQSATGDLLYDLEEYDRENRKLRSRRILRRDTEQQGSKSVISDEPRMSEAGSEVTGAIQHLGLSELSIVEMKQHNELVAQRDILVARLSDAERDTLDVMSRYPRAQVAALKLDKDEKARLDENEKQATDLRRDLQQIDLEFARLYEDNEAARARRQFPSHLEVQQTASTALSEGPKEET